MGRPVIYGETAVPQEIADAIETLRNFVRHPKRKGMTVAIAAADVRIEQPALAADPEDAGAENEEAEQPGKTIKLLESLHAAKEELGKLPKNAKKADREKLEAKVAEIETQIDDLNGSEEEGEEG